MKNVMTSIFAIGLLLLCSVQMMAATPLFLDTFETHPTGNVPAAAEIGTWNISIPGAAVVIGEILGSDSQTLKTIRELGATAPSIRGFTATGTAYEPGWQYVFKTDFFMSGWYHACGFQIQPPAGHSGMEAGWFAKRFGSPSPTYSYIQAGSGGTYTLVDSGVPVVHNQWVTMELVMDIVDSETLDYVTGTYSLYMTPHGQERVTLAQDIPLRDVYGGQYSTVRFGITPDAPEDQEWGGDVINYWDNISIVKKLPGVCGDEDHPYPEADLTGDCKVNLEDFAVIAENWLTCTAPGCN